MLLGDNCCEKKVFWIHSPIFLKENNYFRVGKIHNLKRQDLWQRKHY